MIDFDDIVVYIYGFDLFIEIFIGRRYIFD